MAGVGGRETEGNVKGVIFQGRFGMTFLLLGKKRAEEQLRFEIQIDSRPARFLGLFGIQPVISS